MGENKTGSGKRNLVSNKPACDCAYRDAFRILPLELKKLCGLPIQCTDCADRKEVTYCPMWRKLQQGWVEIVKS